ncbi:MAG: hypothetical protein H7A50_16120 [Akkermansiaceae bacterium]|nr:hypothetical protein [Akkermansiaceae bacterium]
MKFVCLFAGMSALVSATAAPTRVAVDPSATGRTISLDRLLGGNVALWYRDSDLRAPEMAAHLDAWKPGLLRLPGGSWSDEIYWNGNGVRKGNSFDRSKLADGRWQVDFSGYAPGFRIKSVTGALSDFHGHTDVKALHEFVRDRGAEALVTVNAGTGTPEMAAEWARWAKTEGYKVAGWEIGNELDGEWELGHFGTDGKPVDADEYARRFVAFSKAIKAIDPQAKVGGPACSNDQLPFVETLIREAGDSLDFVTFHTYPVLGGRRTEAERFAQADDVAIAVKKIRGWLERYQSQRADQVKIGITEWHKQVMETRPTVDLSSGLWACLFIGAMAESGVDFANLWDMFSTTDAGGHGLFCPETKKPRAMFHALTLWSGHMHERIVPVTGGDETLKVFATTDGDEVSVMLVNTSQDKAREVEISSGLVDQTFRGNFRFSAREYFWNPYTHQPEWSVSPRETLGGADPVVVPPFSVVVSKFYSDGKEALRAKLEPGEPELSILLPAKAPADLPVEGFVTVRRKGTKDAWEGALPDVKLDVDGPAVCEPSTVDTSSAVGRFTLKPTGAGVCRVSVDGAAAQIELTAIEERKEVLWSFSDDASIDGMTTDYQLGLDRHVRPNQSVAAVSLQQATGKAQKNTLLMIKPMPSSLDRGRAGGVIGLLGASGDLRSEDPNAAVQVILQSNHDHWIQIAQIPLSELKGGWKELSIRTTEPELLAAMPELYALRFQLRAHKPVTGRIYFDDLGFILRAH